MSTLLSHSPAGESTRRNNGGRQAFLAGTSRRLLAASLLALTVVAPGISVAAGSPAPVAAAPVASGKLFDAKSFVLANGLQVVVVENHRVPVVSHMVWYKVGAADEPAGHSGLAHLLEHLMFKGTSKIPPGQFSPTIARHGGQDNAFTHSDYTAYFENISVDSLPLVMEMEADRMRNLRLDERNVLTERDVVVEERLSRTENEPAALLRERLDSALWVTHPYRNPVIGWPDELKKLTRKDALEFYHQWYAPNNAVVVVSGDVTLAQVKALAEKYYGPLKPSAPIVRQRNRTLPPAADVRIVMHHPRVAQPVWQQVYLAPGYGTAKDLKEVYALQVLDQILGGGPTSRLYRALVRDHKVAADASSSYSGRAVDEGTFTFSLTPNAGAGDPEKAVAAAEAVLKAELDKLLELGVSDEEVSSARLRMKAGVVYARDSLQGAAQAIGLTLATGGSLEQLEDWPARIGEVTTADVMAAARHVFAGKPSVTGILLPAAPVADKAAAEKPAAAKTVEKGAGQ